MKPVSWHEFRQKASKKLQRILLAEGDDPRVIDAASILNTQKIAIPVLVGSRSSVESAWKKKTGRSLEVDCLDPSALSAAEKDVLANEWLSFPKNKSVPLNEAMIRIQDPLIFGNLCLKKHRVDGFVGGAVRTTADTVRAVFNIIGLARGATTLFGFFLMEKRESDGTARMILLADCAVIPEPSAKQLSNIGIGSAAAWEFLTGDTARVAFLSFSTHGSASHPSAEKVREAVRITQGKAPTLLCDGELQVDAALDSAAANIKGVTTGPVAGKANVLIAPDLNCGNIAYKLAQRLGQIRAVGPVLWGTAQPANDLSRGCTSEDIIDLVALTAIQAQTPQPVLPPKEIN